jgi:hypothetical protein
VTLLQKFRLDLVSIALSSEKHQHYGLCGFKVTKKLLSPHRIAVKVVIKKGIARNIIKKDRKVNEKIM